jgi:AcrR family transcriptional regulator
MALSTPRMPAQERRDALLRAAGPLFARHGYAGTRLDDIAAAAGVTKPIVYRHFDSKKGLYLALLAKHEADLPGFVARAPDAPIAAILDGWLDYVRENQHAWIMLFRDSSGDGEIRELRRRVSMRAREVLAAFIAQRAARRVPPDQVEPSAEFLRSGLAGLALWWIDHPDVPKAVVVEAALRLVVPVVSG